MSSRGESLATPERGANVISASSYSKSHPPSAVIQKELSSFWMTTGSYPQEIVVQLSESCSVKSVEIVSTSVRAIELWGSDGYTHSAGERIAKAEATLASRDVAKSH